MTLQIACPAPVRLKAFLDETLSETEQVELSQHVEICERCQQTLEGLVAGKDSWSDLARHLGHTSAVEESRQLAAEEAKSDETAGRTQAEPVIGDSSIAFLDPPDKPGQLGRLGHYEVQEVIGKGGFGIVLRAFDEKLHRVVAIKVLSSVYAANATARKRFTREAQAAAAIAHDHVVTIHAVEDDVNPPYLVMQFVDGISLQDKLDKEGPLGLKEILRIGLQTAEGLAAAHKQGLVHRDIKPANILLENGVERVKITDFGLARAVDDASLTQSGVVAGTPMYMSPEQAEGQSIDHRSDLFSLGTMLYVMCTGRPPFRASGTMAVLKRVIDDTPRPIRETNPEVPDWLEAIIAKLHAKKPEERFQTAKEVADLLGQHLAYLQQPARSPAPEKAAAVLPTPSGRGAGGEGEHTTLSPSVPTRKRRRWAAAVALLAVLLAAFGFAEWAGITRLTPSLLLRGGILDVLVNDPKVDVIIEGEGFTFNTLASASDKTRVRSAVMVDGNGEAWLQQEFNVRAGAYSIEIIKHGQIVARKQVVVERGRRTMAQFNLDKETAKSGLIRPDSATATSEYKDLGIGYAIDGSGLPPGFGPSSAHAEYTYQNHWTTVAGALAAGNARATFRFDQPVTLDTFFLWNHRSNGIALNPNYGVTRFDLILRDGSGTVLLSLLDQSATQRIATAQSYAFGPVAGVRQVDFIIRANGGSTYTGVAEVAFHKIESKELPPNKLAAQPFVIMPRDAKAERKFATLADAVTGARSGDTIEIRGDGPFVSDSVRLDDKALTIRAGKGYKPVLRLSAQGAEKEQPLLHATAFLVLEGLDLQMVGVRPWDSKNPSHSVNLLAVRNASLHVANCRFAMNRQDGTSYGLYCMHTQNCPIVEVRNCLLLEGGSFLTPSNSLPKARIIVENCLLKGPHAINARLLQFHDVRVSLRNNTFAGYTPCALQVVGNDRQEVGSCEMEWTANIIATRHHFLINQLLFDKDAKPLSALEVEKLVRRCVSLKEQGDLFASPSGSEFVFWSVNHKGVAGTQSRKTLAASEQFWDLRDTGSIQASVRFKNSQALEQKEGLTTEDFRLAERSPGQGILPGGKDVGADVDFVGPGAAYEKWKQTKDYEEWRKKTDALMASVAAPFVILAKGKRAETWHPTLADAVKAAQYADTIEIRGDGPFVTEAIVITRTALTIRAGDGYRPHLRFRPEVIDQPLLRTDAALVLEGLTLEATGQRKEGYPQGIIRAVSGALHITHCRLLGPDGGSWAAVRAHGVPVGSMQNCILGSVNVGIGFDHAPRKARYVLDNNVIHGRAHGVFVQQTATDVEDVSIRLRNNTFLSKLPINFAFTPPLSKILDERPNPKVPGLHLEAPGNILDSTGSVFFFNPLEKSLSLEQAVPLLPRLVSFQDDDNLYSITSKTFLTVNRVDEPKSLRDIKTLAELHKFWGVAKSTSQIGLAQFQGGDLRAKDSTSPGQLSPADFRLAKGSPGQGAGPGGKDLGADVDRVGPGLAYERWLKTPEYQEWRKQVEGHHERK